MRQNNELLKLGSPPRKFSEAFKKKVVREYAKGDISKDQLKRKYGIKGKSAVFNWCRKYGNLAACKPFFRSSSMNDSEKKQIKELEKRLKEAELKLLVYEKLIEVTNRELDKDIIKNIEAKLPENWLQKLK
jgi:transposase